MSKNPLGRLDASCFGMLELPRLENGVLEGFRALGDLTGTTSDALGECRIAGVVPGSTLRPSDPKARVVGRTTWPSRAMSLSCKGLPTFPAWAGAHQKSGWPGWLRAWRCATGSSPAGG